MKCGSLHNGWKYIINPSSCFHTVTILLLFATGPLDESHDQQGLSHFIEHLFFQGTHGKLKASNDITQSIYKLGGYINAYTSYNYTGYYIKIDHKYFENALQVLSEMFFQSSFQSSSIQREKTIVAQENNKHASEPVRLLNNLSNSMVYAGTPLAYNIGGYDEQIKHFTRPMILHYLKKNYNNGVVSLVGGPSTPSTLRLLNRYLGKSSTLYSSPSARHYPRIPIQLKPAIKFLKKDFKESYLAITFPIDDLYQEKNTLMADIISVVLGGNMGSRLFMKLRENKQYVYSIKCQTNHYQIGGDLSIQCGTQHKYLKHVVKSILDELVDLNITKEEMKGAINYTIGQTMLSSEESTEVAFFQAYQYLFLNQCRRMEELSALYHELSLRDINAYAKKIFDINKINLAIISSSII